MIQEEDPPLLPQLLLHPHPQFVAVTSLMIGPPINLIYNVSYERVLALFPTFKKDLNDIKRHDTYEKTPLLFHTTEVVLVVRLST